MAWQSSGVICNVLVLSKAFLNYIIFRLLITNSNSDPK